MKILKTIWKRLNGNKTIICSVIIIISQWGKSKNIILDPETWNLIIGLSTILGTGALGHHIKKGITKKNSK